MIASAYWLAGRAVHRAFTGQPQVELELSTPKHVLSLAGHSIRDAIEARDTVQPCDDLRIINLLVAAEAARRSGYHERWVPMLCAFAGTPWNDRLPATARTFAAHRWSSISILAAELMFERRASVSRVLDICGVKLAA